MTTGNQDSTPAAGGRVLVLLDGSRPSFAALEAAAEIAQSRGAEVLGIYVEEINLLRTAGYAFALEVGASSGQARPLDTGRIEARMQSLADQCRQGLEQAMTQRGIRQALKRCRGQVVSEVLSLAQPDDLLILGRVGWSAAPGARLGSTARTLVRQAPGDVLLWTPLRRRPESRVAVLLDHDQGASHRAVRVGADLARQYHQPLTIIVAAGDDHQANTDDLAAYLRQEHIPARIRLVPGTSGAAVIRALREEGASQLVLSRTCCLFRRPDADALLQDINLPLTVTA